MRFCFLGFVAAMVAVAGGCKKSTPEDKPAETVKTSAAPQKLAPHESAARIHWIGTKRLLAETNAATFKTIWEMPETTRLLSQTLDKLALAPWRQSVPALQGAATNYATLITNYPSLVTNHPFASLMRPLLDDLVQAESYLEVHPRTNAPAEVVLALRLDDARVAAWQTNLLTIAENLAGKKALESSQTNGWSISLAPAGSDPASSSDRLSLSHVGAWALLSRTAENSVRHSDVRNRIQAQPGGNPFELTTTNFWLEAHLDFQRLWPNVVEKLNLPTDLPQAFLTWIGDGKDVQTRGTLTFSKPLPFTIEPWNIPTNLLREPLDSSTGVQGVKPWLESLPLWKNLELGEAPNQVFWWARMGIPFYSYSAALMTNANQALERIGSLLIPAGNKWLATNATGYFETATNSQAILWKVVPFIAPAIDAVTLTNGSFLLAGLAPNTSTNPPPSAETLHGVTSRSNVFYYDWELTGPRIEEWLYIGQLFRVMFNKPQIPKTSPTVLWLKALEPKLRDARTIMAKTTPQQFSLARSSGVGFTAIEIHLLVDWLDSPVFPYGLHTFAARKLKPAIGSAATLSTNSPPATGK